MELTFLLGVGAGEAARVMKVAMSILNKRVKGAETKPNPDGFYTRWAVERVLMFVLFSTRVAFALFAQVDDVLSDAKRHAHDSA